MRVKYMFLWLINFASTSLAMQEKKAKLLIYIKKEHWCFKKNKG